MRPRRLTTEQSATAAQTILDKLAEEGALDTHELAGHTGLEIYDASAILLALVKIGALAMVPHTRKPSEFALAYMAEEAFNPPQPPDPPPPFWARSIWDWGARA